MVCYGVVCGTELWGSYRVRAKILVGVLGLLIDVLMDCFVGDCVYGRVVSGFGMNDLMRG